MSAFTLSSSYAVANASALVKSRGVKVRVVRAPSSSSLVHRTERLLRLALRGVAGVELKGVSWS